MANRIREHLLLGSEIHGTLRTGCGRVPIKIHDNYVIGSGTAFHEPEYNRLRGIEVMQMCGGCERTWRKICRDRNEAWEPTARDGSERGS